MRHQRTTTVKRRSLTPQESGAPGSGSTDCLWKRAGPTTVVPTGGQSFLTGQSPTRGFGYRSRRSAAGYHDSIVGSWGLTVAQLIAIVRSALPHHRVAVPAGVPPWTLIPSCAPGQTPNGNPDSAQPVDRPRGTSGMRPGRRPRRVATRCQGASRNGGTRYRSPPDGIRPG